jgi:hypothetical protein
MLTLSCGRAQPFLPRKAGALQTASLRKQSPARRRLAARPELAMRLSAPCLLDAGRRATVRVTVANQRRQRPSRMISPLWNVCPLRIRADATT